MEGGKNMGKDVIGMIQAFGARGKIFWGHFRHGSSPLPVFSEAFQDDGYTDMYQVMKAFRLAKCTASLIPDHYPVTVNETGHCIANTYSITYMRALLRLPNEEAGARAEAGCFRLRQSGGLSPAATLCSAGTGR